MQTVSALYKQIMSGEHYAERKINIAGTDYGEDVLVSLNTTGGLFADGTLSAGGAVAREIDVVLWDVDSTFIPKMAKMKPYYRLTNGTQTSEWIQKGVFYIDTRVTDSGLLTIHGYDDMLKAEQVWRPQGLTFPMSMQQAANVIAGLMGVELDSRCVFNSSYTVSYPANEYTLRDVLRFIAAAHGGNWIMSDIGELWLVPLNTLPAETFLLCDEDGDAIQFGSDFILV